MLNCEHKYYMLKKTSAANDFDSHAKLPGD